MEDSNWTYEDITFIVQDIRHFDWVFEHPTQSLDTCEEQQRVHRSLNDLLMHSNLAYHQVTVVAKLIKKAFGYSIATTRAAHKHSKIARLTEAGYFWAHADIAEHYIANNPGIDSKSVWPRKASKPHWVFTKSDNSTYSQTNIAAEIEQIYGNRKLCQTAFNCMGVVKFIGKLIDFNKHMLNNPGKRYF